MVSILPADPFAQLELAHKIATYALSSKVCVHGMAARLCRASRWYPPKPGLLGQQLGGTVLAHYGRWRLQVSQLEAEGQQLREAMLQKQNHVKTLERRVGTLELELQELQAKVRLWKAASTWLLLRVGHGR